MAHGVYCYLLMKESDNVYWTARYAGIAIFFGDGVYYRRIFFGTAQRWEVAQWTWSCVQPCGSGRSRAAAAAHVQPAGQPTTHRLGVFTHVRTPTKCRSGDAEIPKFEMWDRKFRRPSKMQGQKIKSKSYQIYFSVAGNNNTRYKSIHIEIWHSATGGMDGQTSWH